MRGKLSAVWQFRQFILSSIVNDIRIKFARSRLGGVWMILHPLAQVLMYAVVLSSILSSKLPAVSAKYSYPLYLTAGIVAWSLFSELVTKCLEIFIVNASLLKKMVFPRLCLPLIAAGSAVVNNLLLLLIVIIIFGLVGHLPTSQILWLPLLIFITVALGLGLGLILGVMNVFVRDVGQVVPILLQFGFWFTPIVYMVTIIPERFRNLIELNPMYHIVAGYQDVLVFQKQPDFLGLVYVFVISLVLLGLAYHMFRMASSELVDEL